MSNRFVWDLRNDKVTITRQPMPPKKVAAAPKPTKAAPKPVPRAPEPAPEPSTE